MAPTAGSNERVTWIDGARGYAIVLVVLFHASLFTVPTGLASPWWESANLVFSMMRMPLFFFVAGMLSVGAIRRPWEQLWRSRIALLVWVFVVWTIIRFAYYQVIPEPIELNQSSWVDLALAVVRPSNGLWFLFALAVFLAVTKLVYSRVNKWVVLTLAATASMIMFSGFSFGNIAYDGIMKYLVFFLCGVYFRHLTTAWVTRSSWVVAASLAFVLVGLVAVRGVSGALVDAISALPVALVGVGFGLTLAKCTSLTRIGRLFEYLGRNTLQIYVTHVLIVSTFASALVPLADTPAIRLLQPVMPLIFTVAAIFLSLLIGRLAAGAPVLKYLYEPPTWFRSDRFAAPVGS